MPTQIEVAPRRRHQPDHQPGRLPGQRAGQQAGQQAGHQLGQQLGQQAERAARIGEQLATRIGPHKYDMWFSHTRLRVDGERLEVATDSQFVARWIHSHFSDELHGVATEALGGSARIDVRVAPDLFESRQPDAPSAHDDMDNGPDAPGPTGAADAHGTGERRAPRRRAAHEGGGKYRRLEDFIVGPCNELAYTAACRICDDGAAKPISPLFIHGECGVGKTHLVQGICQRHMRGSAAARYVTGEQFTNEFITAVRRSTIDAFRARVRKLDLLVIDDVHFLANKVRTQSEFMHTLDAIDLTGARIVLASDEHPRQIKRFSQALISRFLSGMVVQIERPTHETRLKLLTRLAASRGLQISDSAVDLIASRCVGSVREIEGAVTKLTALHALQYSLQGGSSANTQGPGTIGHVLVEQLFQDMDWRPAAPIRIATVIDTVCGRLGITRPDLVGTSRHRRVVLGRALVAFLGRDVTTHSYPEIARAMGRTYHSTVHTAAQRLRRQMDCGQRQDLGDGAPPIDLRELVNQLRHETRRATARAS